MCRCCPFEHFFHRQLCFAVTICRKSTVCLHNRNAFRFSISCCRRRKYNLVHAMCNHTLKQYLRTTQIVIIIFQRLYHAFTHLRICRKVDNSIYIFFIKHGIYKSAISDVPLIELSLRMNRCTKSRLKIIYNYYIISCFDQLINSM